MPNLSIKDVPESLAEQLRQRATRNHRSLQGELMAIVEAAVVATPVAQMPEKAQTLTHPDTPYRREIVGFGANGRPITRRVGTKTIAQIAAELRALFPEPVTDVPLGVDIIRADRDSR